MLYMYIHRKNATRAGLKRMTGNYKITYSSIHIMKTSINIRKKYM